MKHHKLYLTLLISFVLILNQNFFPFHQTMAHSRYIPKKSLISVEKFEKLAFQVCSIKEVSLLAKAKKPSYEFSGDFGGETLRKSCGQFVANYKIDDLVNKQIFALSNLNPVRIAGIKSEYLTLGFNDEHKSGQAIAITPVDRVENGLIFNLKCEKRKDKYLELVDYDVFDSLEVTSATIIDVITSTSTLRSFIILHFGDNIYDLALVPGFLKGHKDQYLNMQVPVITNVKIEELEVTNVTCIAFAVPLDDEKNVTLMKIDKKVHNNLPMF